MTRVISIFLCCVLIFSALPVFSYAAESIEDITYFEDGSYCISTIQEYETFNSENTRTTSQTKNASKQRDYYSAKDELLFSVKVYGSFTYNGTTATAIDAKYTQTVHSNSWRFVAGNANCKGATATANCTFRCKNSYNKTLSASLTCSPDGKLS